MQLPRLREIIRAYLIAIAFWFGMALLMGLQYKPPDPHNFWPSFLDLMIQAVAHAFGLAFWTPPIFYLVERYIGFAKYRFRYVLFWGLGAIAYVVLHTGVFWLIMPPYDDALIIAGQGTAGLEIVEDLATRGLAPDVVTVTASGGGLTAGIALAVKARCPSARVFTAEPQGFDDHARSFKSGQREVNAAITGSICDALLARMPGEITFAINRTLVGEGVSASDDEVAAAVAFAFRELKLVVEPGGAVGLAALLGRKIDARGKVVAIVLSGGNVDPELFHRLVA